jgi:site-specific DNA-methyltransferase (adenine-specific)
MRNEQDSYAQPIASPSETDRISAESLTSTLQTPFYEDAAVTLYHGDCCEIMGELDRVDHVITDPPYARDVYLRVRGDDTAGGKSPGKRGLRKLGAFGTPAIGNGARLRKLAAGEIGYIDDMLPFVAAVLPALVGRWAVIFSDVESTHMWRTELVRFGLRYIRTGAWVKPDAMPQMTGDRPAVGFEPCTIAHGTARPMRWNGGGLPALWTHFIAKGNERPDHPCPKPLSLMVELVTLFTDEGETILDPFAGSGTTGVAAKLNGRKCILIEREEKYCEVAAKRLRQTEPGRLFDRMPRAKQITLLENP